MVDENLIDAAEAARILGINMNNLRQIQHRKSIQWVQKSGRNVYYKKQDIEDYRAKRDARTNK